MSTETTDPTHSAIGTGIIMIYNRDTDLHLKVLKVDNTATDTKLVGAKFQLRKQNTDGEYIVYSKDHFTDSLYETEDAATLTIIDKENGISFEMLTDGNYKLVETKAPDGYIMSQTPELVFTVTDGVITSDIVADEAGFVLHYNPVNEENSTPTVTIGNTPGVELPSTGGSGTLAYTLAGLALILLAGGLLAVSKRRTAREHK